jgi:hypothetical protein
LLSDLLNNPTQHIDHFVTHHPVNREPFIRTAMDASVLAELKGAVAKTVKRHIPCKRFVP